MRTTFSKITVLLTTSMFVILPALVSPAVAQNSDQAPGPVHDNAQVYETNAGVNTEGDVQQTLKLREPFQISSGSGFVSPNSDYEARQRSVDIALERASIQIKNDGLEVIPQLNVSTLNGGVTAVRGEDLNFVSFWNYGAFIEKAEIRIVSADQSVHSNGMLVLPVSNYRAVLPVSTDLPADLIYVLRVYDKDGAFDETEPKPLSLLDKPIKQHNKAETNGNLSAYGVDRTAVRNIQIKGASITVYGENVPETGSARVMGAQVPVDPRGNFVVRQILPHGQHDVGVKIAHAGKTAEFVRELHIDNTDFFYVAIGDLTLGSQNSDGPADFLAASDEDFDDTYVNGRGAFYIKGKTKGEYGVTAALDTGEERIKDIFNNLDKKDSRQLLRRLDADRFYPVYGDDSTLVEDAPTQGKFYVRVDKDDSHIMWGNFATQITSTELAHLDRGLYGGIADYNSVATTSSGNRRTQITAFAADPGTLPAREEFRGTGGSVYFLERQDLSIGSERVRVEIRDKISGLVVETRNLRPQEDYDIDYIQGRILLSDPLQSTARDNQFVRDAALSGNDVVLLVRYEYSPSLADVNGYTVGGRASQWLGDNLRIGLTAQKEATETADQDLLGVDALIRHTEGTYLKAEFAKTKGPGFGQSNSTDGGFNFNNVATTGLANVVAEAYRIEAALDLADISAGEGQFATYFDHQDAGFSGAGRLLVGDVDRFGAQMNAALSKSTNFSVKYDEVDVANQGETKAIYGDVSQKVGDDVSLSVGLRHDDRQIAGVGNLPNADGSRTDISGQIDYQLNDRASLYGFGQATLDRDQSRARNNRGGVGGKFKLNDRLSVNGEVTEGDGGFGANAQANFTRNDNSEVYLGYALSTDRSDTGFAMASPTLSNYGTLTLGGRTRYNDTLSVYGEERFGYGDNQSSLTHVYGLTYSPTDIWSFGASVENGQINDNVTGTFDRTAIALSAARASKTFRIASNLEARFEDTTGAGLNRDRTTWLMRNTVAYDANDDWELLGRFNFAKSESDQADFLNADFVEGVIATAYRPIDNDRFNALLKYTYFEDLAPAGQISSGGANLLPRQRSQIFSADGIYDLSRKLSIGVKYGFRSGEVALDRSRDDFIKSDAHIGVVRLDYHVVREWDLLAEGRVLSSKLADDKRYGALVGIYRHVGEHTKIGVGYNFSKFSDNLTEFDNDSDGYFVNLIGKF